MLGPIEELQRGIKTPARFLSLMVILGFSRILLEISGNIESLNSLIGGSSCAGSGDIPDVNFRCNLEIWLPTIKFRGRISRNDGFIGKVYNSNEKIYLIYNLPPVSRTNFLFNSLFPILGKSLRK